MWAEPLSLGQVPGGQWEATRSHTQTGLGFSGVPLGVATILTTVVYVGGRPWSKDGDSFSKGCFGPVVLWRKGAERTGFLPSLSWRPPTIGTFQCHGRRSPLPAEAGTCLLTVVLITDLTFPTGILLVQQ